MKLMVSPKNGLAQTEIHKPPRMLVERHQRPACELLLCLAGQFAVTMLCAYPLSGWTQIGLGGFSAVMTVPTARVQPDGALAVGFGYVPQPHSRYGDPGHDNLAYFANVGFLPFLEISLRGTRALNDSLAGIGDRMANVRVRAWHENRKRPALVFGLHDLVAIQGRQGWFNALYVVLTKSISLSNHMSLETTAGHGVDWIQARAHEFDGFFGGLSLGYLDFFFLKCEYDTRKFNHGLALRQRNFLTATLVFLDGKTAAFGANLQFTL